MKEKDEFKKQYPYLKKEFEKWYDAKYEQVGGNLTNLDNPPIKMLKRLNLSKKKYYNTFIDPYVNLSKEDLKTTFKILAPKLATTYTKENIEAHCSLILDLSLERKINALEWLLFQAKELNIFNISRKVIFPVKQCFYCGKPDSYSRYVKDEFKIIKFNTKSIFCHKDGCGKGSNPEKHENCCYGEWTRRRKTLEDALHKACLDLYDIEEYENGSLTQEQEDILTKKTKKIFIEFCEKQYIKNLKINYKIRTDNAPAINLNYFSL